MLIVVQMCSRRINQDRVALFSLLRKFLLLSLYLPVGVLLRLNMRLIQSNKNITPVPRN